MVLLTQSRKFGIVQLIWTVETFVILEQNRSLVDIVWRCEREKC